MDLFYDSKSITLSISNTFSNIELYSNKISTSPKWKNMGKNLTFRWKVLINPWTSCQKLLKILIENVAHINSNNVNEIPKLSSGKKRSTVIFIEKNHLIKHCINNHVTIDGMGIVKKKFKCSKTSI